MSSAVANLNSIMLCLFLLCVLVQNDSEQITQAFEEDKVVKQHLLRPKTAEHARAGSKTPFHECHENSLLLRLRAFTETCVGYIKSNHLTNGQNTILTSRDERVQRPRASPSSADADAINQCHVSLRMRSCRCCRAVGLIGTFRDVCGCGLREDRPGVALKDERCEAGGESRTSSSLTVHGGGPTTWGLRGSSQKDLHVLPWRGRWMDRSEG